MQVERQIALILYCRCIDVYVSFMTTYQSDEEEEDTQGCISDQQVMTGHHFQASSRVAQASVDLSRQAYTHDDDSPSRKTFIDTRHPSLLQGLPASPTTSFISTSRCKRHPAGVRVRSSATFSLNSG